MADGYDVWLPVDSLLEEQAVYRTLLDPLAGTFPELRSPGARSWSARSLAHA